MADKCSARFSMVVMGTDNNRQCYRGHIISYSWQFNHLTNKIFINAGVQRIVHLLSL